MLRQTCLLAAFLGLPMLAHAADWAVDPDSSSIEVRYTQGGKEQTAQFESFTADITFDPADLGNASIIAEIDITSFSRGTSQIDGAVASAQWFAASDYPTARFESRSVEDAGGGDYRIEGDLTIRDTTLPVTLSGPITIDGAQAQAQVTVTLDRSNFGVGQGDFATDSQVGFDVPVTITINATSS